MQAEQAAVVANSFEPKVEACSAEAFVEEAPAEDLHKDSVAAVSKVAGKEESQHPAAHIRALDFAETAVQPAAKAWEAAG